MFNRITLITGLISLLSIGSALAQTDTNRDRIKISQIAGYHSQTHKSQPGTDSPKKTLLDAIASWLSENFELPEMSERPSITFQTPMTLFRMRYKALLAEQAGNDSDQESALFSAQPSRVVAIYDDHTKTIALPEGWAGSSPAELSILVHEMVHHMQNLGYQKYACAAEREKLAYQAQERWLKLFGYSLKETFGIDSLTLLLSTRCYY